MVKILKHILIFPFLLFIKLYQLFISPLTPATCRFQPTCSHYAYTAFSRHGFLIGLKLSLLRISKCHPWGKSGYDPVPDKINKE